MAFKGVFQRKPLISIDICQSPFPGMIPRKSRVKGNRRQKKLGKMNVLSKNIQSGKYYNDEKCVKRFCINAQNRIIFVCKDKQILA